MSHVRLINIPKDEQSRKPAVSPVGAAPFDPPRVNCVRAASVSNVCLTRCPKFTIYQTICFIISHGILLNLVLFSFRLLLFSRCWSVVVWTVVPGRRFDGGSGQSMASRDSKPPDQLRSSLTYWSFSSLTRNFPSFLLIHYSRNTAMWCNAMQCDAMWCNVTRQSVLDGS